MIIKTYNYFLSSDKESIKVFYNNLIQEGKEIDDAILETAQKFNQNKNDINKIIIGFLYENNYTKKFEEYIGSTPHISREDIGLKSEEDEDEEEKEEQSPSADNQGRDIIHFGEYRKGSDKWGTMITKIMEWLRLKKEEMKKELDNIQINIDDFQSETNIQLSELENFVKDKISKGLYKFEIIIDYSNNLIKFYNLSDRNTLQIEQNH
jgi:hypothetical protein